MNKKKSIGITVLIFSITIITLTFILLKPKMHSQKPYTAEELGIKVLISENDKDGDGADDYRDIGESARAYILTKPKYKSKYYNGGYPDDGYGVCTDVIWKAFQGAGYDLKEMVDKDIAENTKDYNTITTPDPNIDFRRVKNLNIFLERNASILTTDLDNPEEWQAGDIVVFPNHIAICSDIRNKEGIPFLIHHDSRGAREANDIMNYKIIGHYRWEKLEYWGL